MAAALVLLCGCRTVERGMLAFSRLKSPLTIETPALNRALEAAQLEGLGFDTNTLIRTVARRWPATGGVRFDGFDDLMRKDTVVMVCLSGGGARAARLAAHTLAELESRYNQRLGPAAAERPLVRGIDCWSCVSGGSVYASYVASSLARRGESTNTFARLVASNTARWGTQRLGAAAAGFYFWPGNLAYAPLMQLLTEWDTLNLFARTLAELQGGHLPIMPLTRLRLMGELPATPRFFFNATCLETGRPFVFTPAVLHTNLSGDPLRRLTPDDPLAVWARGGTNALEGYREPLRFASTLEDLGSSPARFPLAHAALGSAAFPGVFQPLTLEKLMHPTNSPSAGSLRLGLWQRDGLVTLVDGGVYDNSGRATALELFGYLQSAAPAKDRPPRLVLISVDADTQPDAYQGPRRPPHVPWHLDAPVRGLIPAASTFDKVYTKQQSLVRAALQRRIDALSRVGALEYHEIRLLDARDHADRLRKIPTDFVLTDAEDALLQQTVRTLLREAPQAGQTTSRADAILDALVRVK